MKKSALFLAVLLIFTMTVTALGETPADPAVLSTKPGGSGGGPAYSDDPISMEYPITYYPVANTDPGSPSKPGSSAPSKPSAGVGSLGSRTLKRTYPCMRGSDVRNLQTMLNALGYHCGRADGIFGDRTKAAVRAFQRANGLKVDGIVGRQTKARLLARYRSRK